MITIQVHKNFIRIFQTFGGYQTYSVIYHPINKTFSYYDAAIHHSFFRFRDFLISDKHRFDIFFKQSIIALLLSIYEK
jgi:hypothetical protein